MAHYPCPNCGGKMFIEEMHEGFVVPCPHCQDTFRVPRGAAGAQKPIRPPVVHGKGSLPGIEGIGTRSEDEDELPPPSQTATGGSLADEAEEDAGGDESEGGYDLRVEAEAGAKEWDGGKAAGRSESSGTRGESGFGGEIVSSRAGPFAQRPPRPRIPEPMAHGSRGGGGSSEAAWILALGIIAMTGCWIISPIPVVMGHKHKAAARAAGREPDQLAMAGYVLGWIGCVILGLGLLCVLPFSLISALGNI